MPTDRDVQAAAIRRLWRRPGVALYLSGPVPFGADQWAVSGFADDDDGNSLLAMVQGPAARVARAHLSLST